MEPAAIRYSSEVGRGETPPCYNSQVGRNNPTDTHTIRPYPAMAIRFPRALRDLRKLYGFTTTNLFTTTNPKTLKNGKVSDAPTIVLHLEPVTFGVCPAAGSCAALCLNKAGNPVYLGNKLPRRAKRSHAHHHHRNDFLQLMILEAARQRTKGYKGSRGNGTSDIAWERETVTIEPDVSEYIQAAFGIVVDTGTHTVIELMTSMGYECYDYTKRIDRDWDEAKRLGYHLTLSWGGRHDATIFEVAERQGLNVAAPVYGIKKSQPLPETIKGYPVVDGDITDWRRADPSDKVHVIGLRLKKTPGQTEALARRFCIV
jgi:hypothetical protein